MGNEQITLIHLSDIHLKKEELESDQDLDQDIRRQLRRDLTEGDLPLEHGVDGILVTGDIAWGGRREEYDSAVLWLQELCLAVQCPEANVWTVPGNHDVSRDVIRDSQMISDLHTLIRQGPDYGDALRIRLKDDEAVSALLRPFTEYNRFAERFKSETLPGAIYWETKGDDDFHLNDGSILRLRGLNSSLVCDSRDDNGPPAGILGKRQVHLEHQPGVSYVTLCHHPPDWLFDQDDVDDFLTTRAHVQLYGHKHRQRVRQIDESVRCYAGALHPDRKEGIWEPRYNVITLRVVGTPTDRHLQVIFYQRVWKPADTAFGPDSGAQGEIHKAVELRLAPWQRDSETANLPPVDRPSPGVTAPVEELPVPTPREIVYQYFSIPYPVRMKLLLERGYLEDGDNELQERELIRLAVQRARVAGKLQELKAAIATEFAKESDDDD